MSETLQNTEEPQLTTVRDELKRLDTEFDSQSSVLSKKLSILEQEIEDLKKDETLSQKYTYLIRDLQTMLEGLRSDGNITDTFNGTAFQNLGKINIPKGHNVQYEGNVNGSKFVISTPDKDFSYDTFKLFLEKNGTQEEIVITNVRRARDGGTTNITTSIGNFYFPSRFKQQEKPTFTNLAGETVYISNDEKANVAEGKNEKNSAKKIIDTLNNISGTKLFTKDKQAYDLMYENFNNVNTMTDSALLKFKEKVYEYALSGGYELQNGFKIGQEAGSFVVKNKFILKAPDKSSKGLKIFFGD